MSYWWDFWNLLKQSFNWNEARFKYKSKAFFLCEAPGLNWSLQYFFSHTSCIFSILHVNDRLSLPVTCFHVNFDATFHETSITDKALQDQTEWHNLGELREAERLTRAPSGSSRWLTDGAGLAGLLTSWFSTAGEAALSLRWATNPLLPLPVTALTLRSHTGTTVTCSWQRSNSSQRNVLAASRGSEKTTAG